MKEAPSQVWSSLNVSERGRYRRIAIRFEKQETDVRAGDTVCERGENVGEVVAIDIAARTIDIKKNEEDRRHSSQVRFRRTEEGKRRCLGGCPVPSRNMDQQQRR